MNPLRRNFRKELHVIENSKKSGVASEDVCVVTLWYFEDIRFLGHLESPSQSWNTIEDEDKE